MRDLSLVFSLRRRQGFEGFSDLLGQFGALFVSGDDQLMRVVVDVDVLRKDFHLVGVAKDLRDLFERDAFGLGDVEPHPDEAQAADDDENLHTFISVAA